MNNQFGQAFRIKIESWKSAFIDVEKAGKGLLPASEKALSLIGRNHRQTARKLIKVRRITSKDREQLREAVAAGDKRKAKSIERRMRRKQFDHSQAGRPPIAHVPDSEKVANIRAIYHAASPTNVVIGPPRANSSSLVGSNRATVPELLEFGGRAVVSSYVVEERNKKGRVVDRRLRMLRKKKAVTYRPRPFMRPTFEIEQPRNAKVYARVVGNDIARGFRNIVRAA